jgi:hypothetical protein
MEFRLEDKELVKLDKEIYEFNKQYGLALISLSKIPNLYAKDNLVGKIDVLIKNFKSIKVVSRFDSLFVSHALKTLEVQKSYLIYFTTAGEGDIDFLFSNVLGKDSLDFIKKSSKSFDYEKYWEYFLSYQEYSHRQVPSDDENIRGKLKEVLALLKVDIMNYAEEHFAFPKDYEFDLVLGQPYSNQTYFHPTTKRMEVAPSMFFVFKENGAVKINISLVINALFHEILGHGRHEFNSKNLPMSLRSESINNSNIVSGIHLEGIAQINREYAADFMKKYAKKYKIEDDYIEQFELSLVGDEASILRILFNYFKLKNAENNKFDVEKEFKKITGNHGLYLTFSSMPDDSIGCVVQAKYPIGKLRIENILKRLEKDLGKKEFEKKRAIINKAISVGVWHTDVLYDFVKLYLKDR